MESHESDQIDKDKYVKKFQKLYKKKTGKEMSYEEALGQFENLASLVNAVYKQIPKRNKTTQNNNE